MEISQNGDVNFWHTQAPEPSYRRSIAWWGRQKKRLSWRKRAELQETADTIEWLRRMLPTRGEDEFVAHSKEVVESAQDFLGKVDMTTLRATVTLQDSTPVSSSRRTTRQAAVLETIDVDEVFWDIASMIDAHRNGATALDSGRTVEIAEEEDPIWADLAEEKWDPTRERGPREREWAVRQRRQPQKKTRRERRGKK